jgi:transposase-like protein
MTDEEMLSVYMKSTSMRSAAKILNIDPWKLRRIRDALNWPKKSSSYVRKNGLNRKDRVLPPRPYGTSIYDAIQTDKPLTQEQIDRL